MELGSSLQFLGCFHFDLMVILLSLHIDSFSNLLQLLKFIIYSFSFIFVITNLHLYNLNVRGLQSWFQTYKKKLFTVKYKFYNLFLRDIKNIISDNLKKNLITHFFSNLQNINTNYGN